MNLIPELVKSAPAYGELRRHIHAHPELGFEEVETAALVAERLEAMGIAVHTGLGTTGVVGTIRYGNSDRTIGLRADMDALPIQELTGAAHASTHDGVFHGCGHDGHTAMLLAAAEYLVGLEGFDGTVHLIFQPAEEGLGGAKAMMDEGLFTQFPCDAVFGMHNWPGLEVGQFAVRSGPFMASQDIFDVVIQGTGGHAAYPQLAANPIPVAADIATAYAEMGKTARERSAVIAVTQLEAGDAYNVIPDQATLRGGVRNFDSAHQDDIEAEMTKAAIEIAESAGLSAEVNYRHNYPVLVNSEAETNIAIDVATALVGADNVDGHARLVNGSEDFAYMLQEKPGCYIMIGGGGNVAEKTVPFCHNPHYDFNDDIIALGASYWVELTRHYLGGE
jgi:amidohydrolase